MSIKLNPAKEVEALSEVFSSLANLSPEEVYRVLSHVSDAYDIATFPPNQCLTASKQVRDYSKASGRN